MRVLATATHAHATHAGATRTRWLCGTLLAGPAACAPAGCTASALNGQPTTTWQHKEHNSIGEIFGDAHYVYKNVRIM